VNDDDHRLIVQSLLTEHRVELSACEARLLLYREHMEAHGVTPPDSHGTHALERFRHVFEIAGHLDKIQHPELLADWDAQRRREEAEWTVET
jgi:hypothetical protein